MSIKKGTAEAAPTNNYIDNTIKHEVLSILKEATEPIPQEEILSILKGKGIKTSRRRLRIVRDKLVKEGVPVCSTSQMKGYWIARTEKEKGIAIKDLKAKADAMIKAARELAEIDVEEYWNEM